MKNFILKVRITPQLFNLSINFPIFCVRHLRRYGSRSDLLQTRGFYPQKSIKDPITADRNMSYSSSGSFRGFKTQTKFDYSTLLSPEHFKKQYKYVSFFLCLRVDINNYFTILSDRYRLEALVQHHQRTSSVKADPSYLTPLHTLCDPLEDRKHTQQLQNSSALFRLPPGQFLEYSLICLTQTCVGMVRFLREHLFKFTSTLFYYILRAQTNLLIALRDLFTGVNSLYKSTASNITMEITV